jgi:hypothetical protein
MGDRDRLERLIGIVGMLTDFGKKVASGGHWAVRCEKAPPGEAGPVRLTVGNPPNRGAAGGLRGL